MGTPHTCVNTQEDHKKIGSMTTQREDHAEHRTSWLTCNTRPTNSPHKHGLTFQGIQ